MLANCQSYVRCKPVIRAWFGFKIKQVRASRCTHDGSKYLTKMELFRKLLSLADASDYSDKNWGYGNKRRVNAR